MRKGNGSLWKLKFRLVVLLGMVGMLGRNALAQNVYGAISGTVLDNTGAAVPGAHVVITSVSKKTQSSTMTNSNGEFHADHLLPDSYTISVERAGFKTYKETNIQVNAGETPRIQASLAIGSVTESVEVQANAEVLIKTEEQDVSQTVSQQTVEDLPIVGQSASNLILLNPGAYAALGQPGVQALNPAGGSSYTVNGQPVGGINYTLDGTDNTGPILGYILINPAPNSIQDAKTTTTSFDAESGRATGAIFSIQTRSGADKFHGLVMDTRTSGANLARDPYSAAQTYPGGPAPALSNQFEANFGGPILRKKLFFFFDYYGLRERLGSSVLTTLPTSLVEQTCLGKMLARDGTSGCDFSEYASALGASGIIYQQNGQPFADNVIPASQLSPQALKLLAMLPAPNIPNSLYNNYSANTTGAINTNQFTIRLDGQVNTTMHAFGRWTYYRDDLVGHPVFGEAGGPTGSGITEAGHGTGRTHSISLGVDDGITSHLVTDLRFGYYEDHLTDDMAFPSNNLGTTLGIPGLNGTGAPLSNGEPVFNIATSAGSGAIGSTQLGGAASTPIRQREDQFQLTNNWTLLKGNHSFKFGTDLRLGRENREESFDSRTGQLTFSNGPTSDNGVGGLGYATFLLGQVTAFSRDVAAVSSPKESQKRTFYYAQDTWRATPKLTVNFGLRWEIYFPEKVDARGHGALLNLDTGLLQVAGYGPYNLSMGQEVNLTAFGPRAGVSYELDPKTVFRVGYGRSYAEANYGAIFGQVPVENPPIYGHQSLVAPTQTSSVFDLNTGPPAFIPPPVPETGLVPVPAGVTATARRGPRLVLPSLDSWNVSIQRALTSALTLTAAYVGNKGTHTYVGDFMFIFPNSPQAVLPGSESITGQTLYYDPSVTSGIDANGHTSQLPYLRPYYKKFGWNQDIQYNCMCGDTHYNALQLTLNQQFSHGLSLTANYAYQKAYNYDSANFTVDKKVTYGPADLNFDQVLTVFGLYKLPFGHDGQFMRSAPKWLEEIVGGYQITPSINLSSGQHFSGEYTLCSSVLPQIAGIAGENAAQPCYPNQSGSFPMKLSAFNPATHSRSYFTPVSLLIPGVNPSSGAFSLPSLDTVGNAGRNQYTGPGSWNVDLALQKNFRITELLRAQFRVDAFNAFNHINASTPTPFYSQFGLSAFVDNPYIGGQVFNRALGTTPRQLDFALKFLF